eukprot:896219_1
MQPLNTMTAANLPPAASSPKKIFISDIAIVRPQDESESDDDSLKFPGVLSPHYNATNRFCCAFAVFDEVLKSNPKHIKVGFVRCKFCQRSMQNTFKERKAHLESRVHRAAMDLCINKDSGEQRQVCAEFNDGHCYSQELCDKLHVCSCCGSLRWCAKHCQNTIFLPSELTEFVKSDKVAQ